MGEVFTGWPIEKCYILNRMATLQPPLTRRLIMIVIMIMIVMMMMMMMMMMTIIIALKGVFADG